MSTIRITSKRQATFPKSLCEEMKVEPGDRLAVERRTVDGDNVWVLRPLGDDDVAASRPSWIGSLERYAEGKPHDMDSIRASMEEARRRGV